VRFRGVSGRSSQGPRERAARRSTASCPGTDDRYQHAEQGRGGHDPGFGKFSTAQRAARIGRNPATGAQLEIKAATAPKFTAGAGLKAAVNANN
jgi:hypothetical protein